MKKAIFCLLAVSCVSGWAQQEPDQKQAGGTALTIYNQDLAVVRTSVDLGLKSGNNEVTTTKVTSQLEPDSVVLRDPAGRHPVQIEEQNYDAAIATQSWMLERYEGQTIDFQQVRDGKLELVQGKILRADANGTQPLIEVNGKMQFQLPGLPLFLASTDGLLLKPTLRWESRAANWNLVEHSTNFEKRDSSTVAFPITVSPDGQQQVSYTVHYCW